MLRDDDDDDVVVDGNKMKKNSVAKQMHYYTGKQGRKPLLEKLLLLRLTRSAKKYTNTHTLLQTEFSYELLLPSSLTTQLLNESPAKYCYKYPLLLLLSPKLTLIFLRFIPLTAQQPDFLDGNLPEWREGLSSRSCYRQQTVDDYDNCLEKELDFFQLV